MALLIEARPRRDQQPATDCGAGFGPAREGGHQPVRWRPRRRRQRDAQTSGPNSRGRARRGRMAMSEVLDYLLAQWTAPGRQAHQRSQLGHREPCLRSGIQSPRRNHSATLAAIRLSSIQPKAKASRLEHSSTRLAVVSARNPLETMSWLRMIHLPHQMLVRIY